MPDDDVPFENNDAQLLVGGAAAVGAGVGAAAGGDGGVVGSTDGAASTGSATGIVCTSDDCDVTASRAVDENSVTFVSSTFGTIGFTFILLFVASSFVLLPPVIFTLLLLLLLLLLLFTANLFLTPV